MFNFIKNIILYLSKKFGNNKQKNKEKIIQDQYFGDLDHFNEINDIIMLYDLDLKEQKTEYMYKGIYC